MTRHGRAICRPRPESTDIDDQAVARKLYASLLQDMATKYALLPVILPFLIHEHAHDPAPILQQPDAQTSLMFAKYYDEIPWRAEGDPRGAFRAHPYASALPARARRPLGLVILHYADA